MQFTTKKFKMNLREEVEEMKKQVEDVQEHSFAMELLRDQRKQNKRLFIIWVITFLALIGVSCYLIYMLVMVYMILQTENRSSLHKM